MTRRVLLNAALVLGSLAVRVPAAEERQAIELRTYLFASEAKLEAFAAYAREALVPALHRAGCRPVGLFALRAEDNKNLPAAWSNEFRLLLLIPHPTFDSVFLLDDRLAVDAAHAAAEAAALQAPMKDPVYLRRETQIMAGFQECPRVVAPVSGPQRVVQLRIYESHNEERARRKVEMFDQGGEIAIFRSVGLLPVFFGRSVGGTLMPNLTYMLAFESPSAMEAAWAKFRADPAWIRLKDDPKYADTVSRITNLILRPLPGSDI